MRAYEEINNDLVLAIKVHNKAETRLKELKKELKDCRLTNGLYRPMSDLKEYAGKEIRNITLVVKENDGTLDTKCMYGDEIFGVTEDGLLHYSSYTGGVMDYDLDMNRYIHHFYHMPTVYNFVGFMDIVLEDKT